MRPSNLQSGLSDRQRRSLPLLLLVALLFSQLAVAAHQYDHHVADIGDPCAECLQLDRTDDVLAPSGQAALPSAGPVVRPAAVVFSVPVTATAAHRQRGPPLN